MGYIGRCAGLSGLGRYQADIYEGECRMKWFYWPGRRLRWWLAPCVVLIGLGITVVVEQSLVDSMIISTEGDRAMFLVLGVAVSIGAGAVVWRIAGNRNGGRWR